MRGILRALVLVGVGLRASAALADDAFDGRQMLASCAGYLAAQNDAAGKTAPSFASGQCAGFVQGAIAAHALDLAVARARTGHVSSKICIPESAHLIDEVRAYQAYLKAHPSKLDSPGIDLLYAALLDAWPCPEKAER